MTVILDMNYMPESQPFEGFKFFSEHDNLCPLSVGVAGSVENGMGNKYRFWGSGKEGDTLQNLVTLSANATARAQLICALIEKLVIPRAFGSKLVRLFAQGFPPKLAKFAQGFPNLDNNSQGHSTS